jgi:glycerol kinase
LKYFTKLNALEGKSAIARGLVFVPSFTGLAWPHGAWMGLGLDTSKRDLIQAVLEGITFPKAEVIAAMGSASTHQRTNSDHRWTFSQCLYPPILCRLSWRETLLSQTNLN